MDEEEALNGFNGLSNGIAKAFSRQGENIFLIDIFRLHEMHNDFRTKSEAPAI